MIHPLLNGLDWRYGRVVKLFRRIQNSKFSSSAAKDETTELTRIMHTEAPSRLPWVKKSQSIRRYKEATTFPPAKTHHHHYQSHFQKPNNRYPQKPLLVQTPPNSNTTRTISPSQPWSAPPLPSSPLPPPHLPSVPYASHGRAEAHWIYAINRARISVLELVAVIPASTSSVARMSPDTLAETIAALSIPD